MHDVFDFHDNIASTRLRCVYLYVCSLKRIKVVNVMLRSYAYHFKVIKTIAVLPSIP